MRELSRPVKAGSNGVADCIGSEVRILDRIEPLTAEADLTDKIDCSRSRQLCFGIHAFHDRNFSPENFLFFSFSCWIYFYFYTKNCRICNMCIFPLSCPFSMIFLVPFSLYWNFITVDWYTIGFKMFRISVPRFNGSTIRSDLERSRYIFDL